MLSKAAVYSLMVLQFEILTWRGTHEEPNEPILIEIGSLGLDLWII